MISTSETSASVTTTRATDPRPRSVGWPAFGQFRDPVTIVRAGVLAICLAALAHTAADPDLWGHLRFGQDILATHTIAGTDPYSFTSDRPWVNHEWLAEVLMAGAYAAAGPVGLVLLKLVLVAAVLALAIRQLRPIEHVMARDRLTALLALAMLTRTLTFRPQVFSLLAFALLLALLAGADGGRRRALVGIPVVMAAWVNLHGGWLVGLAVLGVWLLFGVLSPATTFKQRVALVATGTAALAATLVNPYGIGLWRFVYATVGLARADIADWQPMYAMPLPVIALWLVVVVVAVALVWRAGRTCPPRAVAIVGSLAVLSLRVNRLDAFLAIAVVMLLGPSMTNPAPASADASAGKKAGSHGSLAPAPRLATGAAVALAVALVLPASILFGQTARCVEIPAGFPESEAARFVLANHLRGRMVTWFGWGEYAIAHFAPDIRVSIDGRRETVYSDAVIADNWRFATIADPTALVYVDLVSADYVWMPNTSPAIQALARRGWTPIFAGPVSTILARHPAAPYRQPAPLDAPRCYPGP